MVHPWLGSLLVICTTIAGFVAEWFARGDDNQIMDSANPPHVLTPDEAQPWIEARRILDKMDQ